MQECLKTWRVAGPCAACGAYQLEGVHLLEGKIYCADCCPDCGAQDGLDWTGEPVAAAGEQGGLF